MPENDHPPAENKSGISPYAPLLLLPAAGASIIAGFGLTIAMAKKSDPEFFMHGSAAQGKSSFSGVSLATRALLRATVYTFGGTFLLCGAALYACNIRSWHDFNSWMRSAVPEKMRRPRVQRQEEGPSDFKSLQELVDYILSPAASKSSRSKTDFPPKEK